MQVRLFDVQTSMIGIKKGEKQSVSAGELLGEMDFCHVDKAVARILPDDLELDFEFSNQKLFNACKTSGGRLLPCPIVVPNSAKDIDDENVQVDKAVRESSAAVRIRPGGGDCWEMLPWVSDPLFQALAERKMPLMLPLAQFPFKDAAELAQRFSSMPIILHNVAYNSMRQLLPFLSTFKNTYLSIGSNFTFHMGIEHLIKHAGAQKLLFGSNAPDTEMMSAITQLAYAKISDEEKQLIGAGNLENLIAEIVK